MYQAEHLILTILYTANFILLLFNIYLIFFHQKKWHSLPLFFFYLMAFIAISIRLVCCFILFMNEKWIFIVYALQPAAKLCVGLAQAWMIFELTVRIRQARILEQ